MQFTEFTFILRPSKLGGVGVFAAHDISQNTYLSFTKSSPRTMKIADVPANFLKFCIFLNQEECLAPERFDRMEIGWYLNHSHDPNIKKIPGGIIALRDIKMDEEILMDYNQLNEPEELKEPYYKVAAFP